MDQVICPGCGKQTFSPVACSECYCSCGTAFRIGENGLPVRVPRPPTTVRPDGTRAVRRLFEAILQKPGKA